MGEGSFGDRDSELESIYISCSATTLLRQLAIPGKRSCASQRSRARCKSRSGRPVHGSLGAGM